MQARHLILALLLCGCATKFGARLGDQSYYHKPHCADPVMEWVGESYAPILAPSRRRIGGMMGSATSWERTPGHWHYYC